MITKEITLCGKPVTLGYCFATEISFKDMAEQDITDFMVETIPLIQANQQPDIKSVIYLILSCILPYYEDSAKAPVTDRDIMRDATPEELGIALGTIITMRADFYHIPAGEPEDKGADEKNA